MKYQDATSSSTTEFTLEEGSSEFLSLKLTSNVPLSANTSLNSRDNAKVAITTDKNIIQIKSGKQFFILFT